MVGEVALIGPELVHEAIKKVLLISGCFINFSKSKKSYVDERRKDLEFYVQYWFYMKI